MTNAEAITLMMSRLGERTAVSLRSRVVTELNEKIKELERADIIPWFLETRLDLVTIANQNYIDIPSSSNFLREVEDGRFRMQNSEGKWFKLAKRTLQEIEDGYENCDAAFPKLYSLNGKRFYFGYTPDAVYNIRVQAYVRSGAVADNGNPVTNDWLLEYFNFTTLSTLDVVARLHVQSNEVLTRLEQPLRVATDRFWRDVEARENANLEHLVNDSED